MKRIRQSEKEKGGGNLLTAIVTIIIFLVMISLHEFGHFIVAKFVGVKVLEFAIGMGPAIVKWKGKETQYSLRILPVGGYCQLDGENEKTDDERAFCNQKWWKRFLVIVAGAVLNILLGFVVLFSVTAGQKEIATPYIASVVKDSYLSQTSFKEGDRIVAINGKHIGFYQDIALYTENLTDDEEIEVTVKRDGEKITEKVRPSKQISTTTYEEDGAHVVTSLNGGEAEEAVYDYTDKELAKEHIGESYSNYRYIIGFSPKAEKVTFLSNCVYSYHYTWFVVKLVYNGLWDMITGKTGLEQVSGPVGIVSAVNTAVKSGSAWVTNVLFLVALLTINLGVFNLLPLPALDGGRLLFMIIELLRGKPVPQDKEGMVHAIGLIILLAFAVVISFKDIIMLFK